MGNEPSTLCDRREFAKALSAVIECRTKTILELDYIADEIDRHLRSHSNFQFKALGLAAVAGVGSAVICLLSAGMAVPALIAAGGAGATGMASTSGIVLSLINLSDICMQEPRSEPYEMRSASNRY